MPFASAAMSESGSHPHPLHRIGLPVLMARRVHSQHVLGSSSRRLGTWCNAPATTGDCRGHMRRVQGVRLGEERHNLVVPVDEDMTRRREDVGGATLWKKSDFLGFGGKKGSDGLQGGVCTIRASRGTWVGQRSSSIFQFAFAQGYPQLVTVPR
jgi:hypothetical protein